MATWLLAIRAALEAKTYAESWARFQKWRKERKGLPPMPPGASIGVVLVAAYLSAGASCGPILQDLGVFCAEFPWEKVCGGSGVAPTSTPAPTNAPAPTAVPTATPIPTHAPTVAPTSAPAPTVTPVPTPVCAPKPGPTPVSLAWHKRCPTYMEPLEFEGEGNVTPATGFALCAAKAGRGDGRTAWRLGYGLARQGMTLHQIGNAWVQRHENAGRWYCADAYGRSFPDCDKLYPTEPPEFYPYGERGPYEVAGNTVPEFCGPTPAPTRTPGPTPAPGAGFPEALRHLENWKPSDLCHSRDESNGIVKCGKDSTQIYPFGPCDRDHPDAFFGACGGRTWDDIRGPEWSWQTIDSPGREGDIWSEWHSSHRRDFYVPVGIGKVRFTACPRVDVGAPVDFQKYESGGYDDIISNPHASAEREAVPRIPIPVKGNGCRSADQVF